VTHWIFALKYNSIACRLELITKGENPEKLNQRFTVLNGIGIFFNVLAGISFSFVGNPENIVVFRTISISQAVSTVPPIVSCSVLANAFFKFEKFLRLRRNSKP
jgi:hypothetical protein